MLELLRPSPSPPPSFFFKLLTLFSIFFRYAFILLVVFQLLMTNVSFLGHLCGILSGFACMLYYVQSIQLLGLVTFKVLGLWHFQFLFLSPPSSRQLRVIQFSYARNIILFWNWVLILACKCFLKLYQLDINAVWSVDSGSVSGIHGSVVNVFYVILLKLGNTCLFPENCYVFRLGKHQNKLLCFLFRKFFHTYFPLLPSLSLPF